MFLNVNTKYIDNVIVMNQIESTHKGDSSRSPTYNNYTEIFLSVKI